MATLCRIVIRLAAPVLLVGLAGVLFWVATPLFPSVALRNADSWEWAEERGRRLDQKLQASYDRMRLKEEIVQGLIDHRLTLAEAARQVRGLHEANDGFWFALRLSVKGISDDERLCRWLVEGVVLALHEHPDLAKEASGQLESQIEKLVSAARLLHLAN